MTDSDSSRGSDVQGEASPRPWRLMKYAGEDGFLVKDAHGRDVFGEDDAGGLWESEESVAALIIAAVNAYAPPPAPAKGRGWKETGPVSVNFPPEDYAHTAALLRDPNEKIISAALSNNFNIILNALDICARPSPEWVLPAHRLGELETLALADDPPNVTISREELRILIGMAQRPDTPSGAGGERGAESRVDRLSNALRPFAMNPPTITNEYTLVRVADCKHAYAVLNDLPSSQKPEDTPANGEGRDRLRELLDRIHPAGGELAPEDLSLLMAAAEDTAQAENERLREIRHLAQTVCTTEGHHQRFDRALRDLRAALAKEQGG